MIGGARNEQVHYFTASIPERQDKDSLVVVRS